MDSKKRLLSILGDQQRFLNILNIYKGESYIDGNKDMHNFYTDLEYKMQDLTNEVLKKIVELEK